MSHGAAEETLWGRLTRPTYPIDLVGVVLSVLLADLLLMMPALRDSAATTIAGLSLLFFFPGYALVALLFPESGPDESAANPVANRSDATRRLRAQGVDGVERLALSFGVSLALLPLFGIALAVVAGGFATVETLAFVSFLTVSFAVLAAVRRLRLPEERRFRVPFRAWAGRARSAVFEADTRADAVMSVGLAAAVLVAVSAVGYAVAVPADGEQFTEFSLLTENDDGELVASGYPDNLTRGSATPLHLAVENHEQRDVSYTVVVELQRVEQSADGGATVVRDARLDTYRKTVSAGETWQTQRAVTPTTTGENLRLTYLLYTDEPPENPSTDTAYRSLHVWVNVTD